MSTTFIIRMLPPSDVVVVGSGVAGLRTALSLAPLSVTLVTKSRFGRGGSSPLAQGGIAAAIGTTDSPAQHAQDTNAAGGGLNDARIVEILTRGASRDIESLAALGVSFDRDAHGRLELGREGGHSLNRIVHAGGDRTGAEIMRALQAAVAMANHIQVIDQVFVTDLELSNGRVIAILADAGPGSPGVRIPTGAVVLATGGAGQLFACTTNAPESTGDGMAIAVRAGAQLIDLEFVQFHPTALQTSEDPLPLLTEALRGAGAQIIDDLGERFLASVHPAAELAPRDVVARSIRRRQDSGRQVFLDLRNAPGSRLATLFPTVDRVVREAGFDPQREPLPITPAAHYSIGGISVDANGRTNVAGLWACGETSSTGAHGANRLASNGLLEALVFGNRVAASIVSDSGSGSRRRVGGPRGWTGGWRPVEGGEIRHRLREVMWNEVGIVRDHTGLVRALRNIDRWVRSAPADDPELLNLLLLGRMTAAAALARRESRGSHVRSDKPTADRALARRLPAASNGIACPVVVPA